MLVHTFVPPAFLTDADGNSVRVRMTDTRARLWRKPRRRKLVFTRVFRGDVSKARLVADLLTRHYAARHLRPVEVRLRVASA